MWRSLSNLVDQFLRSKEAGHPFDGTIRHLLRLKPRDGHLNGQVKLAITGQVLRKKAPLSSL
jgi:hypothetical protein